MDIRSLQKPLKDSYREDAGNAQLTIKASGNQTDSPLSCSVDIGRAVYEAQAHKGVGGAGTGACSGDLLLGALAACAQITCQMVAENMGLPVKSIHVEVEGDLDLRGTLGIDSKVPVGFTAIRTFFHIDAPELTDEQKQSLQEKTERYCVVYQTLSSPAQLSTIWDTPKAT